MGAGRGTSSRRRWPLTHEGRERCSNLFSYSNRCWSLMDRFHPPANLGANFMISLPFVHLLLLDYANLHSSVDSCPVRLQTDTFESAYRLQRPFVQFVAPFRKGLPEMSYLITCSLSVG
jgi:hypothetical protein